MAIVNELATYVKRSIQSPLLSLDPVYKDLIENGGVEDIIYNICLENKVTPSAISVSAIERKLIVLETKKEIYFRLATTTAPEFDVEERYTKILKSQRFEHYIKLWDAIRLQMNESEDLNSFTMGTVSAGELVNRDYDGRFQRNYNLAQESIIELKADVIAKDHVDLSWSAFDYTKGSFASRHIYIGTATIYDPYSCENLTYPHILPHSSDIIQANVLNAYNIYDVKRTKFRVSLLTPATLYYIVLRTVCTSGFIQTTTLEVTTLPA